VATKATSSWWELAECRSADPELFFPMTGTRAWRGDVTRAKAMCSRCPIRKQCLDYAIESHQAFGVWGGASEEERRLIAARRRRDLERCKGTSGMFR
jgi:WhiB family transcriptional regulator, redox-sensing transcriptional regulator